jgi:N-acetylneuraminic acid mutarotase
MVKHPVVRVGVCAAIVIGLIVLLRLMPTPVAAENDQGMWVRLEDLPVKTQEVGVAAAGGKVYVVGGSVESGQSSALTNNVWAYDPASDSWSPAAALPGPARDHIGVASVGGKLYAFGGLTSWPGPSVPNVYEYDPATNGWTPKAEIPNPRPGLGGPNRGLGAMGVAVIGNEIYLAGGLNGSNGSDALAMDTFIKYNPATNSWTTLPNMPTARDHLAVVAVGGKLHAIGGRDIDIDSPTTTHEMFDPASGQWTPRAPLPSARGGMGAGVLNGKIIVYGGEGPNNSGWIWASTDEYDPGTNSWRTLASMGVARHGTSGATLNGAIYAPGGGESAGGGNESAAHERFMFASMATATATTTSTATATATQTASPTATATEQPELALDPRCYVPLVTR